MYSPNYWSSGVVRDPFETLFPEGNDDFGDLAFPLELEDLPGEQHGDQWSGAPRAVTSAADAAPLGGPPAGDPSTLAAGDDDDLDLEAWLLAADQNDARCSGDGGREKHCATPPPAGGAACSLVGMDDARPTSPAQEDGACPLPYRDMARLVLMNVNANEVDRDDIGSYAVDDPGKERDEHFARLLDERTDELARPFTPTELSACPRLFPDTLSEVIERKCHALARRSALAVEYVREKNQALAAGGILDVSEFSIATITLDAGCVDTTRARDASRRSVATKDAEPRLDLHRIARSLDPAHNGPALQAWEKELDFNRKSSCYGGTEANNVKAKADVDDANALATDAVTGGANTNTNASASADVERPLSVPTNYRKLVAHRKRRRGDNKGGGFQNAVILSYSKPYGELQQQRQPQDGPPLRVHDEERFENRSVKVFANYKLHLNGSKSMDDFLSEAHTAARLLGKAHGPPDAYKICSFHVEMVNSVFRLRLPDDMRIDLKRLHAALEYAKYDVIYERVVHPAVNLKIPTEVLAQLFGEEGTSTASKDMRKKRNRTMQQQTSFGALHEREATVLFFNTGCFIITGYVTPHELVEAYSVAVNVLANLVGRNARKPLLMKTAAYVEAARREKQEAEASRDRAKMPRAAVVQTEKDGIPLKVDPETAREREIAEGEKDFRAGKKKLAALRKRMQSQKSK